MNHERPLPLDIRPSDALPIYRQIMHQITDAVASGKLEAGAKLPSQRDLAEQLVISPLTVKKAYDELEREGLIETQRGRGTFVAATSTAVDKGQQLDRLRDAARLLMSRAYLTGVSLEEVLRLLTEIDEELQVERAVADGSSS